LVKIISKVLFQFPLFFFLFFFFKLLQLIFSINFFFDNRANAKGDQDILRFASEIQKVVDQKVMYILSMKRAEKEIQSFQEKSPNSSPGNSHRNTPSPILSLLGSSSKKLKQPQKSSLYSTSILDFEVIKPISKVYSFSYDFDLFFFLPNF